METPSDPTIKPFELPADTWTSLEEMPADLVEMLRVYALSQQDDVDSRMLPDLSYDQLMELYDDLASSECVAAFDDARPIGLGVFHQLRDSDTGARVTYVEGVAVAPEARRRKVGQKLISAIVSTASDRGDTEIRATAQPTALVADVRMTSRAGLQPEFEPTGGDGRISAKL